MKTAQVFDLQPLPVVVDELGALRAQIKTLQDQAKSLEQALKNSGEDVVEGSLFRASISRSLRTKVDWKAIAAKLSPSRQLVTAHTSESEVVTLRLSGHKS